MASEVDLAGVAQAPAVPPTVISAMRSVGWPDETGTPWPSLPHVPGPGVEVVAHHVDLREHLAARCRSAGPAQTGAVISPSSIMYASVIPKTKSPVAVFDLPAAELHAVEAVRASGG